MDGKALLDDLEEVVKRFVVLPKRAAEALALWIVHTYAFDLRDVTSYVGVESPEKRCGKTTLLMLLCELVHRPIVAANISSSAFFRVIEETRPTLLIDEADTVLHRNKELQGILNAGVTRRTAFVLRVTTERGRKGKRSDHAIVEDWWETQQRGEERNEETEERRQKLGRYSSYCPKAIAMIGHLPDTLGDRCIVIPMQRKTEKERCEKLRNLSGTDLRRKCARFVQDHAREIRGAAPSLPEELNDRAADIWEPLLAIADLAGSDWPEKARRAALELSSGRGETAATSFLLGDVLRVFLNRGWGPGAENKELGKAFSREIVAKLKEMKDRPWSELLHGRRMTEVWLSHQLRPYGVRPRTLRMGGDVSKGYLAEECWEALGRYIPREPEPAEPEERRGADGEVPETPAAPAEVKDEATKEALVPAAVEARPEQQGNQGDGKDGIVEPTPATNEVAAMEEVQTECAVKPNPEQPTDDQNGNKAASKSAAASGEAAVKEEVNAEPADKPNAEQPGNATEQNTTGDACGGAEVTRGPDA